MKKKILLFGAVALFTAGTMLVTTSCDDDNPVSCAKKLTEVTDASLEYLADDSNENCLAYKSALEDYINCDGIDAVDKAAYRETLEALPCY